MKTLANQNKFCSNSQAYAAHALDQGRMMTSLAALLSTLLTGMLVFVFLVFMNSAANAQNLFAPVAKVNDSVVTQFELNQRAALLKVLGGGASQDVILEALIEDRLKSQAAERAGLQITDELIATSIQEFAARGDLKPEQLISLLAKQGVSAQTLRDFVSVGVVWRELARGRFLSKAQVSESEIDRALASNGPSGGLRVLMSEIFLPARTPEEKAKSEAIAKSFTTNPTVGKFAAAAAKYSVAPSREKSGRLDWVLINNLPPVLRAQVLSMKTGDVTEQLATENAIGYFQLRAIAETEVASPVPSAIEYAAYYIAGGQSEAARSAAASVAARVDTCEDLYAVAKDQGENALEINTLPLSDIPQDVAIELAKLDANEISTSLTRAEGQTLVFLMLCGRSFATSESEDREAIRQQLQSARLASLADNYLAELKADATIVR